MPAPSGLTPSDSCYVKHLPASYGVQEVQQLFETHGAVLDVKLFPCLGGLAPLAPQLMRHSQVHAARKCLELMGLSRMPGRLSRTMLAEQPTCLAAPVALPHRPVPRRQRTGAHGISGGSRPSDCRTQQQHAARGRAVTDCAVCRVGSRKGGTVEQAGSEEHAARRRKRQLAAWHERRGTGARPTAAGTVGAKPR